MAARGTSDLPQRRGVALRHVITGAMGSGKTALLSSLAETGCDVVGEFARAVIAEQRAVGGSGLYDKDPALFWKLMLERAVSDHIACEGWAFFDRGIPDLIGYAEIFGLDPSPAIVAAEGHRYADAVFVVGAWEEIYTTDEDRTMSFELAARFGDRVREIYDGLGYTIVDMPKDTVDNRRAFVLDTVGPRQNR